MLKHVLLLLNDYCTLGPNNNVNVPCSLVQLASVLLLLNDPPVLVSLLLLIGISIVIILPLLLLIMTTTLMIPVIILMMVMMAMVAAMDTAVAAVAIIMVIPLLPTRLLMAIILIGMFSTSILIAFRLWIVMVQFPSGFPFALITALFLASLFVFLLKI